MSQLKSAEQKVYILLIYNTFSESCANNPVVFKVQWHSKIVSKCFFNVARFKTNVKVLHKQQESNIFKVPDRHNAWAKLILKIRQEDAKEKTPAQTAFAVAHLQGTVR